MGPVGMPGISIPGPPGPKVCILGDIFFFYLDFLEVGVGKRFIKSVKEF